MGRKKIDNGKMKCKISITILPEVNNKLETLKINKSKLINSLLQEYLKN
jgi:hypothetical protein